MIVAFCGSKGSGKSTSATIFKELSRDPVEEIAIAGHLKQVCANVFLIDYNRFIDPALKEVELNEYIVLSAQSIKDVLQLFYITDYDFDTHVRPHIGRVIKTPRALLQYIGTEVLHPIDPLVHVKVALKKKDPEKVTLITDLRFVAEFKFFRENYTDKFFPVYVKNSAAENKASVDSHASEREYVTFASDCRFLNNEGSLNDLKLGLIQFMDSL